MKKANVLNSVSRVACRVSFSLVLFLVPAAFAADGPNQTFTCDMKTYVPFDATTTVSVECPDSASGKSFNHESAYTAYSENRNMAGRKFLNIFLTYKHCSS